MGFFIPTNTVTMIELYSKVFGLDLEVELNYQPEFYLTTSTDTMGDASIPYGTCTVTTNEASVSQQDIIHIYMAIDTKFGEMKVDLIEFFKQQNLRFKYDFCLEIDTVIESLE